MLRTGKTPEITVRSAISAPPSFRKLHCGGQKQPNSLVKQIGLIPRRQAAGRSAERAHVAIASQPTPYALPSWSQKTWLALARLRRETSPADPANDCWLCGGVGMRDQPTLRFSLRCEAGCRLCFRDGTQHTLSVWSFVPHFHLNSFRADNSPRAGPFGTELRSDNVALCAIPLPHCHADCCPDSPSGTRPPPRGSQRASLQASIMPTPPRREFL